ncbi:MAG: thiolase family protein [Thermoprotei archaeon]|jgi:acetyl-CoA C-acetyltransferase
MNSDVVIVSAVRTPIGKFGQSLAKLSAIELGAIAIKEAINRAGIDPKIVDEIIMGNVVGAGLGQNPARVTGVLAGLPENTEGYTVNKVCASSLKAVALAAQAIKAGDAEVVVAGGMESMSNAPFLIPANVRWGWKVMYKSGPALIDTLTHDGLEDYYGNPMGLVADQIAKKRGITREEADTFAYESHKKAGDATLKGYFKEEIIPIDITKDGEKIMLDRDEGIRYDTSVEKLLKLKPFFSSDGITTAGNASQISDGASAVIVTSMEKAKSMGLKPLARILGYASAAIDLVNFIEAPVPAIQKLLKKLNMTVNDIDLIEINEAFAIVPLIVSKDLNISLEKINVHGGAIALGHPIGASGARILTTLIYALKQKGLKRGLAGICHGGGGAFSMMIEVL